MRARNRALLARQHLLARTDLTVDALLEHLVGMQAQEPRDPYTALWSRLQGFQPAALEQRLIDRSAVRLPVMRTTLHLVTARDAPLLWGVARPGLARVFGSTQWGKHLAATAAPIDAIVDAGVSLLAAQPLSTADLRTALGERFPDYDSDALAQAIHYRAPVIQVPPRGLWTRTGRAAWTTMQAWLGTGPLEPAEADLQSVVMRYLGAFGPATPADVTTWSGRTGAREILESLRPRLVTLRDEDGRELFDLPDAPRPAGDTPAPPRFLPQYDNLLLSHKVRRHVIADTPAPAFAGWVGSVLVDGFACGQWDIVRAAGGATIELNVLRPLTAQERSEVESEAASLLRLHAPAAQEHRVVFGELSRWRRRSAS